MSDLESITQIRRSGPGASGFLQFAFIDEATNKIYSFEIDPVDDRIVSAGWGLDTGIPTSGADGVAGLAYVGQTSDDYVFLAGREKENELYKITISLNRYTNPSTYKATSKLLGKLPIGEISGLSYQSSSKGVWALSEADKKAHRFDVSIDLSGDNDTIDLDLKDSIDASQFEQPEGIFVSGSDAWIVGEKNGGQWGHWRQE